MATQQRKLIVFGLCLGLLLGTSVAQAALVGFTPSGGTNSTLVGGVVGGIPAPPGTVTLTHNVFPPDNGTATANFLLADVGAPSTPAVTWTLNNTGPFDIDEVSFRLAGLGGMTFGPVGVAPGWNVSASPFLLSYTGGLIQAGGGTFTFNFVLNAPGNTADQLLMTATAVPEPSSWLLGCLGMVTLAGWASRRRKKKEKNEA